MAPVHGLRRSLRVEEQQRKRRAAAAAAAAAAATDVVVEQKRKQHTGNLLLQQPTVNLLSSNRLSRPLKKKKKNKDPLFNFRKYKAEFPRDVSQAISAIYYDPTKVGSYSSLKPLFSNVSKLYPELGITEDLVKDWLSFNKAAGLTKPRRKHFRRRKTVVGGVGRQYQADLMDMALYRSHAKGSSDESDQVLVVIDCFSRKAAAVPVKSKHGINVMEGFKEIFKMLPIPLKIQTDEGGEFWNKHCRNYFKSLNIIHFSTYQEMKAPIVERFIRTLREKLKRYAIGENTSMYKGVLPYFINNYNKTPHSSIGGFAPADVNKDNESFVFQIQYGPYLASKIPTPNFAVGDIVRAAIVSHSLKKAKKNYRDELFVVSFVNPSNPPTYVISTLDTNIPVMGSYYGEQLIKLPGT